MVFRSSLFKYYWSAIIIILPFYIRNIPLDTRVQRDMLFLFVSLFSLVLFDNFVHNIWFAFCGLFFVNSFFGMSVLMTSTSFFQTINLLCSMALVSQFAFQWNEKTSRWLANAFCVAGLLQVGWIACHYFNIEPSTLLFGIKRKVIFYRGSNQWPIEGSLDASMVTACYLAAIFPFYLRRWWIVGVIPLIVSLYLLGSAMGFLGVCCVLIYLFFDRVIKWNIQYLIASIVLLSTALVSVLKIAPSFTDSQARYTAWGEIIKWSGLTWFGKGIAQYHDIGYKSVHSIPRMLHPHNEYLAIYVNWGAFGIILVLIPLWWLFKSREKEIIYSCAIIATLGTSFGAFPLHISSTALIVIIAMGALLSDKIKSKGVCI